MRSPFLAFAYRVKLTSSYASAAFYALALIDLKRYKLMTRCNIVGLEDRVCRTVLRALSAADTFFRIDLELNELLTYSCRTFLVNDVSDIFVFKVAQR